MTTPKEVKTLKDNEIFVFGSNLNGSHGGGAALLAKVLVQKKESEKA